MDWGKRLGKEEGVWRNQFIANFWFFVRRKVKSLLEMGKLFWTPLNLYVQMNEDINTISSYPRWVPSACKRFWFEIENDL